MSKRPRPEGAAQKFQTFPAGTWPDAKPVSGPTAEQVDALIADARHWVGAQTYQTDKVPSLMLRLCEAVEALRRRLDAAEQERDGARKVGGSWHSEWWRESERAEAAEAEVARLTEALEQIAYLAMNEGGLDRFVVVQEMARSALSPNEEEKA